ncbi:hypothetical protein LINPERPRIM_LOCUS2265 [Linum perenne]
MVPYPQISVTRCAGTEKSQTKDSTFGDKNVSISDRLIHGYAIVKSTELGSEYYKQRKQK